MGVSEGQYLQVNAEDGHSFFIGMKYSNSSEVTFLTRHEAGNRYSKPK